mmetsp:Transcript_14911/g.28062  ORF Transcript_14911/g.28062 Transcript_14911/m.28062 type:complete len:106 (-) Transcript_14911:7082-7399(-)
MRSPSPKLEEPVIKPVMVESRFLRHLTSFGTPGGACDAFWEEKDNVDDDDDDVLSIGFPKENVRAAADDELDDVGDEFGEAFGFAKEKVREDPTGDGVGGGGEGG